MGVSKRKWASNWRPVYFAYILYIFWSRIYIVRLLMSLTTFLPQIDNLQQDQDSLNGHLLRLEEINTSLQAKLAAKEVNI